MGIFIDTRAARTDTIGALVGAVTPGGPAALAGIRSGDIITAMNGARLVRGGRPHVLPGTPGVRLIELAASLNPGDTVNLRLRRDGEDHNVTLVAERAPPSVHEYMTSGDSAFSALMNARDQLLLPLTYFSFGMSDLELAPVNPMLGRYFGVSEGVLVVQVPEDSHLNLEPGDVILSVGNRAAQSPSHVLRILRSYQGNEPVRMEVIRMKDRIIVNGRP